MGALHEHKSFINGKYLIGVNLSNKTHSNRFDAPPFTSVILIKILLFLSSLSDPLPGSVNDLFQYSVLYRNMEFVIMRLSLFTR